MFQLRNLEDAGEERNLLLINVSPIDQGHSLLVPWADRILPQQVAPRGALHTGEVTINSREQSHIKW